VEKTGEARREKNRARRCWVIIRTRAVSPRGGTNASEEHKVSGSELEAKRPEMEKR
jgi:hypothetical protein